jgi:hypothetical protein
MRALRRRADTRTDLRMTGLMAGKRGLIMGVANDHSILPAIKPVILKSVRVSARRRSALIPA